VRELGALANLLGIARDDPADLRRKIEAAVDAHSDLLLTSGGASVGDFDYVKDVIGATGDIHFWRVQIRPGKPIVFGTIRGLGAGRLGNHTSSRSLYLLGLPGNPTSAMVTYYIFARPAILTMMGHPAPIPEPIIGRTDDLLDNRGGRETYFRVVAYRAAEEVRARLAGDQDSSLLLPLSRANALARVPADTVRVEPDQPIELYPLESYGHPLGALWALVNE
jgi:molybdopterin molybdotransferase